MCLVNKLKSHHAHHQVEAEQYSSRTDPNSAAWMQFVHLSDENGQRGLGQMSWPHSDQTKPSRFAVVQFERN